MAGTEPLPGGDSRNVVAAQQRGASLLGHDSKREEDIITENLSQKRKAEISSVTGHPIHSSGFSNLLHLIFTRGRLE